MLSTISVRTLYSLIEGTKLGLGELSVVGAEGLALLLRGLLTLS